MLNASRRLSGRLSGPLSTWLARLGLAALVLFAAGVTALRLALPVADRYRGELTALAEAQLQTSLAVETLSLRLAGWSPRLVLGGVVITSRQTGEPLLKLRALELDLDLWASLAAGRPRVRALTLVGAHLTLVRAPDGRFGLDGLAGLGPGGLGPSDPGALAVFMHQGRLNLTDSEVLIADVHPDRPLVRLTDVRLRLVNDADLHRFELLTNPVPARGTLVGDRAAADRRDQSPARLRLIGDLRGDPATPSRWGGTLYLDFQAADLSPLWPAALTPDLSVRAGEVHLESWTQLSNGALVESLDRLALRGLRLAGADASATTARPPSAVRATGAAGRSGPQGTPPRTLRLDHLEGLIRVARPGGGWQVQAADLGLALDGAAARDLELDLRLDEAGQPRALGLKVRDLDLRALGRLAAAWPAALPPPAPLDPALIVALDPRGHLGPLNLHALTPADAHPAWQAAGEVRGFGLTHTGRLPGLTGLDARLRADQDGGQASLTGRAVALDLRPLFDPPVALDRLDGELAWERGPAGGWQLTATRVWATHGPLEGQAHFTLDLPPPGDPAQAAPGPVLDLAARVDQGELTQTRLFLPVGILSPKLTDWLTQALAGGTLTHADLILRGPLHEYPFRSGNGRYDLTMTFTDLTLRYRPGWPPLTAAAGALHFVNQGLDIRLDRGRVLATEVTAANASIPDLWHPHLSIHAEGQGPFADGLRFIRETPLAATLAPAVAALSADGRARLALDLGLPLDTDAPLAVNGRLTWPQPAGLRIQGTPIALTGLTGQLDFSNQGVRTEGLGARLWGRPLTLSLTNGSSPIGIGSGTGTETATGTGPAPAAGVTRVQARARLPVGLLATHLPSPYWRLASGELDCDLGVELPQAAPGAPRPPLGFSLASDLRGLALDLPHPLGKPAARANPLRLEGVLDPGRTLRLGGTLAPLAWDLQLALDAPRARLGRGRVTLGAGAAAPATAPGLAIDGTLDALNLPDLTAWWERAARTLGDTAPAGLGSGVGPLTTDLRIGRLDLGGTLLTDARVQASPAGAGLDLRLTAREAGGLVRVPGAGSGPGGAPGAGQRPGAAPADPLVLDLDYLDLKALLPDPPPGPAAAPAAGRAGTAPRRPPALEPPTLQPRSLELRIASLRWGETALGRLDLDLLPDAGGFRVERIRFEGLGETRVSGEARWVSGWVSGSPAGPGEGRGQVTLDLRSADTGPLLRALDFAPLLSPAEVEARLRLDWPGAFADFALARAAGRIELDVGPGRILDVDPGVGRVLGFLNLGELRRRLTLDFTDLYRQGFDFARMTGRIEVRDGLARLSSFDIDGPASDIRVSGTADLRTRTFDQRVTVEPSIGTSVALASAVGGGPAVGAAVYLVDRLTGGAIDRLASYQYRMTGPWAKPELTRLGWEPFAAGPLKGALSGAGTAGSAPTPAPASGTTAGPPAPAVRPAAPAPAKRDNLFLD